MCAVRAAGGDLAAEGLGAAILADGAVRTGWRWWGASLVSESAGAGLAHQGIWRVTGRKVGQGPQ